MKRKKKAVSFAEMIFQAAKENGKSILESAQGEESFQRLQRLERIRALLQLANESLVGALKSRELGFREFLNEKTSKKHWLPCGADFTEVTENSLLKPPRNAYVLKSFRIILTDLYIVIYRDKIMIAPLINPFSPFLRPIRDIDKDYGEIDKPALLEFLAKLCSPRALIIQIVHGERIREEQFGNEVKD